MKAILAVDQSTAGTKSLLFDLQGNVLKRSAIAHRQSYPQDGWVEHDPEEIIANVYQAIALVMAEAPVGRDEVGYLALTNQRETVVVWNRRTGKPMAPALVWQDQRGTPYCERLVAEGTDAIVRSRTGLIVDSYFSATKIQWVLEHVAGAMEAARRGELLWGTIDSWMIWNLTNRRVHATDYSNACRTMLFNIDKCCWDAELLHIFGIPPDTCPDALPSDSPFGEAILPDFPKAVPIYGVMGDSHAALFGQCCFAPGMAKVTYGTGSSIMVNSGDRPVSPPPGIVGSIGWGYRDRVVYVLEGNVHAAGDILKWQQDSLKLFADYAQAERMAESLSDNGGTYLVPSFNGLGAPYWEHGIPALITGMTRTTTNAHFVRAAFEAIAYQVHDVVTAIAPCLEISELRVDGGVTANSFVMQLQSDLLDIPIRTSYIEELSILGVVYMGGLATGVWADIDAISSLWRERTAYLPRLDDAARRSLIAGWNKAVRQALAWRTL